MTLMSPTGLGNTESCALCDLNQLAVTLLLAVCITGHSRLIISALYSALFHLLLLYTIRLYIGILVNRITSTQ